MTEIDWVWSRIRGQIPPLLALEPRRVASGQPPLSMERWLLAESYLYDGAAQAHATGGPKTFRRLLKTMRKNARAPTKAELFELYPPLAAWLDSLPAQAGIL